MIRDFSKDELEPVADNHTELTLGLGTVLGLGAGLLLLCIVCFALGYAAGHRGSTNADGVVFSNPKSATATNTGATKPGAVRQPANRPSQDAISVDSDAQQAPEGQPTSDSSTQVRPALQSSTGAPSDTPLHVQPATSQVQGWMVQIAAVSRTEDADVLVGALKKRGYAVTARRELGDNLIHVQTGPFTSRNDANTMRQKLLNDGYNAIVQ